MLSSSILLASSNKKKIFLSSSSSFLASQFVLVGRFERLTMMRHFFPGFTPFGMTQNNDEQSWCYSGFDLFFFFFTEFPFIFLLNCGCLSNSVLHFRKCAALAHQLFLCASLTCRCRIDLKLYSWSSIYSRPPNMTSVRKHHINLLKTYNKINTACSSFFFVFFSFTVWYMRALGVTTFGLRRLHTNWQKGWDYCFFHGAFRWLSDV